MDGPDEAHTRPDGVSDATVEAVDTVTRALETMEVARGHLLQFHRLTGTGDTQLREAIEQLRHAGHDDLADRVEHDVMGRNVIEGRWTFQIVEDYDANFISAWREMEQQVRDELVEGRNHLLESEMKEAHRTHGRRHHESRPPEG